MQQDDNCTNISICAQRRYILFTLLLSLSVAASVAIAVAVVFTFFGFTRKKKY